GESSILGAQFGDANLLDLRRSARPAAPAESTGAGRADSHPRTAPPGSKTPPPSASNDTPESAPACSCRCRWAQGSPRTSLEPPTSQSRAESMSPLVGVQPVEAGWRAAAPVAGS